MCCTNILGCAVVIASIATAVLCLVGLAIPVWYSSDAAGASSTVTVKVTTYEGLWQRCTSRVIEGDDFDCTDLSDLGSDYTSAKKAVLAMCFIGMACIICTAVIMVLHLTLCGTIELLTKIAGIIAWVAALLILIGVIVYATKVKDEAGFSGSDLSAGFGLCLASAIACVIIGGVCWFVE